MQAAQLQSSARPSMLRRSATCRAPRKRTVLLGLSKRSTAKSILACAATGGDGPSGPGGPVPPVVHDRWGGDDNNGGSDGNAAGLAVLAVLGLACASLAHPASAAAAPVRIPAFVPGGRHRAAELARPEGACRGSSANTAAAPREAVFELGSFTDAEKELVVPKQYRVREIVYVH